ncbi:MAG TPA: hypothetical protein EYP85_16380, partial [Armatimonadetes bacterium]|nr:hypothetical protein [Armatimonadota bacterium]
MQGKTWSGGWLGGVVALWTAVTSVAGEQPAPWHHPLSYDGGGYWRGRLTVRVTNLSGREVRGGSVEVSIGPGAEELNLVGQRAEAIRVCDVQGRELLFDLRDAQGGHKRRGPLAAGDRLSFAVEVPPGESTRYYVYFANHRAWEVVEFLRAGLENAGFEGGEESPAGWHIWGEDSQHHLAWVTDQAHTGRRCVRTTVEPGAPATWVKYYQDRIPVIPGVKYVLRGWVKAQGVEGQAGWYIHVHGDRPMLINRVLSAGGGTYDWRELTFEFEAPATATTANVGTVLYGTGTAWFDDVSLEPAEPMPLRVRVEKAETRALTPAPAPSAWPDPQRWPYRLPVTVYHFAEEAAPQTAVFVDLRKVKWRRFEGRPIAGLRMSGPGGRLCPHLPLKDGVLFLADLPPRSARVFYLYLSPTEESEGRLDYADLVRSPANLVRNPDFTEGQAQPANWEPSPVEEGGRVLCRPARVREGLFGEYCVRLEIPPEAPLRWSGWHQEIPAQPNTTYIYSGYLKAEGVDGEVRLHGHFHDAEGRLCRGARFFRTYPTLSGKADWTQSLAFVQTPADCASVQLHLTMNAHGTVWHDGIVFCEAATGLLGELETRRPPREAEGDLWVWTVNPLVKVFPDTPPASPRGQGKSGEVQVFAARNEYEPFQLALRSPRAWKQVRVEVSALANAQGEVLPPVQVNRVGTVLVDHPSSYYSSTLPNWYRLRPRGPGRTDGWAGEWPDPLPPCTPFDLPPNRTQALWFTVRVPADAAPGEYGGTVRLTAGVKLRVEIPVRVTVWDFTLPRTSHLKVIFDLRSGPGWNIFAGPDPQAKRRTWYRLLAEHRICPGLITPPPRITYENGQVRLDTAEFDEMAHYCLDELGMNVFYTPWFFYAFGWAYPPRKFFGLEPFTPEYNRAFTRAYRAFLNHLREKGWHDKVVYYVSDEPHYTRPEVVENLRRMCELAHAADPEVPIYSSTWRWVPEWAGHLDIWGIGQYGCFPVEVMRERLTAGD